VSDTGWLEDFPDEWRELRADFLCYPYRETVSPERFEGRLVAHYSIPQVQETGGPLIEPADDIDSAKLLIRKPTLLVSKLNPRKKTICIAEPQGDFPTLASGEFVPIQSDQFDQRYAFYLWASEKVTDRLSAIVQSATRSHQRVNPDDILKLPWKWPPLATQKRIAAFLDKKIAQIDALIGKKQTLLDRLVEKRQAIITQAVTKGLNLAAPMKDSGIEWLGQIPAHWEVVPLRRMATTVVTGRTPPAAAGDFFTDGTIPWFTPGDFSGDIVLGGAEKFLTEDAFTEGLAVRYPTNVVLLVGIGATLGKVALAPSECSSNQQINAIAVSDIDDPTYLTLFLQAFRDEVRMVASGNTLPILNQDKTKSILIARPPRLEQQQISSYAAATDREIELLTSRIRTSIGLLTERRSALITAAVTGQIEGLQ